MQRRDYVIIKKVVQEISVGIDMLGDVSLEEFLIDEKLKRAVAMTTINIGELVKNITAVTRQEYSSVPWKAVAGMRDMAAHKYQTLRMQDVYQTAKVDFPALKAQLEEIINMESIKD